jgi:hypothetical protein
MVFMPVAPLSAASTPTVYEIEIVVFENKLSGLEGGELWRRDTDKALNTEIAEAVTVGEKPPVDSALAVPLAKLANSGQYRILAHLRWTQTAEAKSVSKPVKISSDGAELKGTVRFYLSRFLHMGVNLALKQEGGGLFNSAEKEGTVFRLTEHRRIKTMDLNYFDHPKFGALVRVAPGSAAPSGSNN